MCYGSLFISREWDLESIWQCELYSVSVQKNTMWFAPVVRLKLQWKHNRLRLKQSMIVPKVVR